MLGKFELIEVGVRLLYVFHFRQVDVRKTAVGGYLLLLKKFTVRNAVQSMHA